MVKLQWNEERPRKEPDATWREREREREGRRGEKCTRPNRAGYRCISDDAFQEFRARSTLEEFFFPSSPSLPSCDVGPSPSRRGRSLAHSLARPRIQNNVPTLHRRVPLLLPPLFHCDSLLANRQDQLAIILFATEIFLASGET